MDVLVYLVAGGVMQYSLYLAAVVLGIVFRYQLGLANACKVIGVRISSETTKTGYQDAVTPPSSTNLTMLVWVSIVALFLYVIFGFGWSEFWIVAGTFILASIVAGASFVPKPDSAHYVRRIYRSMANRYADYVKAGDTVRADVMKELIDRVEETFANKLA
jgi:hypothetical protein